MVTPADQCKWTGKRRFDKRADAVAEIARIRAKPVRDPGRLPVACFECRHCLGWHMTADIGAYRRQQREGR